MEWIPSDYSESNNIRGKREKTLIFESHPFYTLIRLIEPAKTLVFSYYIFFCKVCEFLYQFRSKRMLLAILATHMLLQKAYLKVNWMKYLCAKFINPFRRHHIYREGTKYVVFLLYKDQCQCFFSLNVINIFHWENKRFQL